MKLINELKSKLENDTSKNNILSNDQTKQNDNHSNSLNESSSDCDWSDSEDELEGVSIEELEAQIEELQEGIEIYNKELGPIDYHKAILNFFGNEDPADYFKRLDEMYDPPPIL